MSVQPLNPPPQQDRQVHIQLRWHNPFSQPPDGMDRVQYDAVVQESEYRESTIPEINALEEQFPLGTGWSWHWQLADDPKPRKQWSKEAKGRVRKSRLKTRLQKKMPLFWEDAYKKELAARPDYFRGEDPSFKPLHGGE